MWRVAVLGAGRMGHEHARAWSALAGRARLISIASRTPAGWAAAFGTESQPDLTATILRSDVDVIDICLPTPLHRQYAQLALEAGKHVLVEKPLALSVADADAILASASRAESLVMVAHVVRFTTGYRRVREVVESSRLGRPLAVSTHRLTSQRVGLSWIRDDAQSGGAVVDLLVHDYDQMNLLLGTADRVRATQFEGGVVCATANFVNGGVGTAQGCVSLPDGRPFSCAIRVSCEGGAVEYATGELGNDRSLQIYANDEPGRAVHITPTDPFVGQAAYFLDALDGALPHTQGTLDQGRAAVAVAAAALRSLGTGTAEQVGHPSR